MVHGMWTRLSITGTQTNIFKSDNQVAERGKRLSCWKGSLLGEETGVQNMICREGRLLVNKIYFQSFPRIFMISLGTLVALMLPWQHSPIVKPTGFLFALQLVSEMSN